MLLTVPLVTIGLFRYLYLVNTNEHAEMPERLIIQDPPLVLSIIAWIGASAGDSLAGRLAEKFQAVEESDNWRLETRCPVNIPIFPRAVPKAKGCGWPSSRLPRWWRLCRPARTRRCKTSGGR